MVCVFLFVAVLGNWFMSPVQSIRESASDDTSETRDPQVPIVGPVPISVMPMSAMPSNGLAESDSQLRMDSSTTEDSPPSDATTTASTTPESASTASEGPFTTISTTSDTTSPTSQGPSRASLTIVTWNAENWNGDPKQGEEPGLEGLVKKGRSVMTVLKGAIKETSPAIISLQEVEGCKFIETLNAELAAEGWAKNPRWACVDAVTDAGKMRWARNKGMVLGDVVLYDAQLFTASHADRVLEKNEGYSSITEKMQKSWKSACNGENGTAGWENYKQCNSILGDMPEFTSVRLSLNGCNSTVSSGIWSSGMCDVFGTGIRAVAVHLFAGGTIQGITDDNRLARRSFQLKAQMALIDYWNDKDDKAGIAAPTTIYAGDFNTREADQLTKLVKCEREFGVKLWCPADGGDCAVVPSKYTTHGKYYLDHVALDVRPPDSRKALLLKQASNIKPRPDWYQKQCKVWGCSNYASDHNVLTVTLSPKVATENKPRPNPWGIKLPNRSANTKRREPEDEALDEKTRKRIRVNPEQALDERPGDEETRRRGDSGDQMFVDGEPAAVMASAADGKAVYDANFPAPGWNKDKANFPALGK